MIPSSSKVFATSSGTPSLGIGAGNVFTVESATNVFKTAAKIEVVSTDVTSASEDFDFVFKNMKNGATAAETFRITSDGRLYGTALHNNAGSVTGTTNQYIASGTYTPTFSNTVNVSSSTANKCRWTRVGNVVTVSGKFTVTPTAAASTATNILISLPIPSNFTSSLDDCSGIGNGYNFTQLGVIDADTTNDGALFGFKALSTSSENFRFEFTYEIL